jgi:predicted CXXCH cytochrome family protein
MIGGPSLRALRIALLLSVPWPGPAAADGISTCTECHRNLTDPVLTVPVKELAASVHTSDAIGCAACHKGDPLNPTVGAHDARKGFVAHPSGRIIVEVCGGCHADARFLLKFGVKLPTDQRFLYEESPHGKLVQAGDTRGPTCATCHGTHDAAGATVPTSRVSRGNVAELCASCHANPSRMAPSTLPSNQYVGWARSVHAEALRAGNPNAPTCTGCHDAHLAVRPQLAAVTPTCTRCHKEELTTFDASSHSKPFARLGFDPCVPCHGNHDVPRPSTSMLSVSTDGVCARCHAGDDKPRKTAERLYAIMREAEGIAMRARATLSNARSTGLTVTDNDAIVAEIAEAESQLRQSVHGVDPAMLSVEAVHVRAAADRAGASVARASRMRLFVGAGAWTGVVVAALLGLFGVRRLRRRRA